MLTCRTVAEPAGAPAGDIAASGCVGLGSGGRGAGSGSAWNRGPSSPPARMSPEMKTQQKGSKAAESLIHSPKMQSALLDQIHCGLTQFICRLRMRLPCRMRAGILSEPSLLGSRTHRGQSRGPERPGARRSQARRPKRPRCPAPSAGGLRH